MPSHQRPLVSSCLRAASASGWECASFRTQPACFPCGAHQEWASHLETARSRLMCCCSSQAPIPKQYLEIMGQPIALYSLRTFDTMPEVGEIIVVCEPEYRHASVPTSQCTGNGLCGTGYQASPDALPHFIPSQHEISGVLAAVQVQFVSCRQLFTDAHAGAAAPLRFAAPGRERQDSVFNGFQVQCVLSIDPAGMWHDSSNAP